MEDSSFDSPMPGLRIAGRYELTEFLGRGAAGEVWRARDHVVGGEVACKLTRVEGGVRGARGLREVALLRRLRLPGVATLLDEGVWDGRRYLVMELAEGRPFPSRGEVVAWDALAPTVISLLQTLGRVHDAGVVHRDLKPENVLVDARGRPTLLDFGVSWEAAGESLTRTGDLVGTPLYVAPEQVLNERVTPATDLYALGVMLYEALTGRRPFEGDDVRAQVFGRLFVDPKPLRSHRAEVSPSVDALVLDLLRRDAAQRPRSARDVVRRILDVVGARALEELVLDDRGAFARALSAVRAGESVDVVGRAGSGRSHLLRRVREALVAEGRPVVVLHPSDEPFGSVASALPPGALDATRDVGDARRVVAAALRGAVIVGDDAERLDPWTVAALEGASREGGVALLARTGAPARGGATRVELGPHDEVALRALFEGPELLLHIATDAARILHRRTDGLAGSVVQELDAWVRAGMASLHGGRVRVARDALERLSAWHEEESLASVRPRSGAPSLPPELVSPPLQAVLRWVALLAPDATIDALVGLLGRPRWDIDARVDDLVRKGLIARDDDRLRAVARVPGAADLDVDPDTRAHLLAVLPTGSPRRLSLLLSIPSAEATPETVRALGAEARSRAAQVAREGRVGAAVTVLAEAVLALRNAASHESPLASLAGAEERGLLAQWLELAVSDSSPAAVQRLAYEVTRAIDAERGDGDRVARLRALADAARIIETTPGATLDRVASMARFDDPALERVRLSLWVRAARVRSLADEAALLDRLLAERGDAGAVITEAMRATWLARLRYRQGRFRDAAVSFARAATAAEGVVERLTALLAGASAWMEAFAFEEAESAAREALALAEALRHAVLEARARWILRASMYRRGRALDVDDALLEAVTALEIPYIDALVALNEAAVAWRAGRHDRCAALALRARAAFATMGMTHGANLSLALVLALDGAAPEEGELTALAAWCPGCDIPGIGIQAAGLLASRHPSARRFLAPHAEALAAQVDRAGWGWRAEVVSVDEALAWLGAG